VAKAVVNTAPIEKPSPDADRNWFAMKYAPRNPTGCTEVGIQD